MRVHSDNQRAKIFYPEFVDCFGVELWPINLFNFFYLGRFNGGSTADNGKIAGAKTAHSVETALIKPGFADNGTHSILLH